MPADEVLGPFRLRGKFHRWPLPPSLTPEALKAPRDIAAAIGGYLLQNEAGVWDVAVAQ